MGVTLRTRLTAAFLAMVLGPVLLGALFVGSTVHTVNTGRVTERLNRAASTVHTSLAALCAQLGAVAEAVAAVPEDDRPALAAQFVRRGMANGVHIEPGETTPGAPPPPWADCAGPGSGHHHEALTGFEAVAAYAGPVSAAFTVDLAFVERLAAAGGAAITLLPGSGEQPKAENLLGMRRVAVQEPVSPRSTLDEPASVTEAAYRLKDGMTVRTEGGDLVKRLGPVAGQPLPLAVSLRSETPRGTYALLILIVLACAVAAVIAAWWLARSTTHPLVGLAAAADRVAAGDLATRVPSRGKDEIGRLATAFNHMTRELSTYVDALTASRDQLRGHLGVLGDTLSSTHDLDRILQVILQTARHATGASSGLVLLAEADGTLVGKCAEGFTVEARVPMGQGLVGSVAATGVPRLGRIDRDGPLLDPGEPGCRTYIVVPFCMDQTHPSARGVLALYDRHGRDDFDEADLDTLRTFAGQAAVAVDNVRVHEEAQRLSVTDSLTGLFNHRSLRETLRRETDRAGRFGRKLAVLALDLDHFKDINDRYGHATGDAVLADFAQCIRHEIREVDVAFRQGGEEFALLLPETDEIGGIAVAERLCTAIRRAPVSGVSVTVSIGVAVFPDHGHNGSAVLRAADEALYAAKTAGRDGFKVASEIGLSALGNGSSGASSGPQAPRQAQGR